MRKLWLNALLDKLAPLLVLIFLLFYTYVELWQAPYLGFNFSSSTGEITLVFEESANATLLVGDRIAQVNDVTWKNYVENPRQSLFPPVNVGDTLTLHIVRVGKPVEVTWSIHSPTVAEVLDRAINVWWLGYIFWLTGTLTAILIRPKDTRWRLLIAFYYLTASWLVVGNTSRWYLWDSSIVLRILIWFSVPVYLHLHWVFPRPLGQLPRWFWPTGYVLASVAAYFQWIPLLPRPAYLYGFMVAIVGSLFILVLQWFIQSDGRPAIRLLLWATGFAFLPILGINIAHTYLVLPWFGPVGLLGLVPIPAAYFYAVYRYQLGQMELRTNRVIALYLFTLIITTLTIVAVSVSTAYLQFPGDTVLFSLLSVVFAIITTATGFPVFQRFVERYFLGIPIPQTHLLESYASRIGTRLTRSDLIALLQYAVMPSLLVRESALVYFNDQRRWDILYYSGVVRDKIPTDTTVLRLYNHRQKWLKNVNFSSDSWVRITLPLQIENNIIGYWLLGRRDPDNFYSQTELPLLQSLADQTAIALTNIEQAIQLRALNQANVDRHEVERTHLALTLHDDVLNLMARLSLMVNGNGSTDAFDEAYTNVTTRIRQLITGLRPAMLAYGLGAALEELTDDLADRGRDHVQISCNVSNDDQIRLEPKVEEYLFRIVQQAAENALHHAKASTITIKGLIEVKHVKLEVSDDGIGLATGNALDLNSLLVAKHYGIVGMYERAGIIGAQLDIDSQVNQGTCVKVSWSTSDIE
ncbi:MAG: hypothetical protein KDE53_32105 [Caldilineaceae bacterium]|nr:hypothetical protein [Caldilineaceae bacterium]